MFHNSNNEIGSDKANTELLFLSSPGAAAGTGGVLTPAVSPGADYEGVGPRSERRGEKSTLVRSASRRRRMRSARGRETREGDNKPVSPTPSSFFAAASPTDAASGSPLDRLSVQAFVKRTFEQDRVGEEDARLLGRQDVGTGRDDGILGLFF